MAIEVQTITIPGTPEAITISPNAKLVFNDPATGKDFSIKASNLLGGQTLDYTWLAGTTYVINNIVEWGGNWWKSLINGNIGNIPSENANWTQVSPADESAIKIFQAGKVYKSDVVVVMQALNLYSLKTSAGRPYSKATFVDTDWDTVGTKIITIDTSASPFTFAFDGPEITFLSSNNLAANMTALFSNPSLGLKFTWFFNITGDYEITFPSSVKMDDIRWDTATKKWRPSGDFGIYRCEGHKMGTDWLLAISKSTHV